VNTTGNSKLDASNQLFLFDIDGTLVNIRPIWEQAYRQLYRDVCSFELTDDELKSLFGPPEREGHSAILEGRKCCSETILDKLVDQITNKMVGTLESRGIEEYVLPGVKECLAYLEEQSSSAGHSCSLGIVTGNIRPIAEAILNSAKLREYFSIVACAGPETKERREILQQAISLFSEQGKIFGSGTVYVIGDTPSDISAAQKEGHISVAVATGNYNFEQLSSHRSDYTFRSLVEFREMLRSK
jgi:phosphoglycolate phosphatase-like HAD superfamily hydrolase